MLNGINPSEDSFKMIKHFEKLLKENSKIKSKKHIRIRIEVKKTKKKYKNKKIKDTTLLKQKYAELLLDNRWIEKTKEIKKRDNFKCKKCGSKKNLHVHHLKYRSSIPWKTPDKWLITLCKKCHKKEHKINV